MAPHSKRKNRSKALKRATGISPYPLSVQVSKIGSDILSASNKYASDALSLSKNLFTVGKKKAKKNTRSIIRKSKKVIKDSADELHKSLYEPKIQLRIRTIFMSLRDIINEKWSPYIIPRYTYAKAVERFMKKYDSPGARHIIETEEIAQVKHVLEGPISFMGKEHQGIQIIKGIFSKESDASNVEKVVELLEKLFYEYLQREEEYKSMIEPNTSLEMGQGWAQARVAHSNKEFTRLARDNTLIKLKSILEKQKKFLDKPKIKPTPSMLYEMNNLQKEALSIIDEHKNMTDLTDDDIEIVQLLNEYVFPLMKKYPELESYNKGSSKKKSKSKKKTKGKKKVKKKRTHKRKF